MEYEIRPVSPEEAPALGRLINAVKDEGKYLFYTLRFTEESTRSYVESHAAAGNPVIGAFAPDGEIVGWIDFSVGGFEEIRHVATVGMGVAANHRGAGLGERLLRESVARAGRLGVEKLELEVFATNSAARGLYEKLGFVEEGRLRRKRKFRGNYEDLVCMGLFLEAKDAREGRA